MDHADSDAAEVATLCSAEKTDGRLFEMCLGVARSPQDVPRLPHAGGDFMTLTRRCDGCGNDIDQSEWLEIRIPKRVLPLEFHNERCIELWLHREHR